MRSISGSWPGTQGDIVDTITVTPKVSYYSAAIEYSALSCCPRRYYVTWEAESGGTTSTTYTFGSLTLTQVSGIVDLPSSTFKTALSAVHIRQRDTGCAQEPHSLKICMSVVDDPSCASAALLSKTCSSGASHSYVDIA